MRQLFLGLSILILLLAACSATIPAPIHDDSVSRLYAHQTYRVMPGDTLYSIAFETGHDYQQLARWNAIRAPYRIESGETLRLTPPSRHLVYQRPSRPSAFSAPLPAESSPRAHRLAPPPGPYRPTPRRPLRVLRPRTVPSWIWPAQGFVEQTFGRGPLSGRPGNKGIDILGHAGEPIRAAAAGRAVYIGSGLPGYGELIIIKQNNDYLSAYAHNGQVKIKEGAMVKQGQVIATMGDSGTDRVELEFEIRLRGVPVNPIRYLPTNHH